MSHFADEVQRFTMIPVLPAPGRIFVAADEDTVGAGYAAHIPPQLRECGLNVAHTAHRFPEPPPA